jgi:hypothetical protein
MILQRRSPHGSPGSTNGQSQTPNVSSIAARRRMGRVYGFARATRRPGWDQRDALVAQRAYGIYRLDLVRHQEVLHVDSSDAPSWLQNVRKSRRSIEAPFIARSMRWQIFRCFRLFVAKRLGGLDQSSSPSSQQAGEDSTASQQKSCGRKAKGARPTAIHPGG